MFIVLSTTGKRRGVFVTGNREVRVNGAKVAYRVRGQGPALILVNGTGALDIHWGSLIERLSSQKTVITLDYSGSGDTIDDGSALTLEKLTGQVLAVANSAGAQTFDLFGYSLGAVIATYLASEYPGRVRRAVLLAGFTWGGDPGLTLQFDLWLDLIRTNRRAYMSLLLHSGLTPQFLSRLGTDQIEQMIESGVATLNWEGFSRQMELNLMVDIRLQATRVRKPFLVIGGSRDQVNSPHTRELAENIPGARYHEIDAGHIALFEREDEIIELATTFLCEHNSEQLSESRDTRRDQI
jgi:3-oxoadipate enol-lactonase